MQLSNAVLTMTFGMGITLATQAAPLPQCVIKHYADKPIKTSQIRIDAPDIAENGGSIPVQIQKIEGTGNGVYVKELRIFNEYRSDPVATFSFGKTQSAEQLKTRLRLPDDSRVIAVATLSNGQIISGERLVKVTIGGCGGGETDVAKVSKMAC